MAAMEPPAEASGEAAGRQPLTCPWCGSTEVERTSAFGPSLMLEQYFCRACGSPFGRLRRRNQGEG
jgi:ribosomal protein L37AE/L43A